MDMDLAGTVLEDWHPLKKPLEHWNLQWVKLIKESEFNAIHEVKDALKNAYVLRISPLDPIRMKMWEALIMYQLPNLSRILSTITFENHAYILEAYFPGKSLKESLQVCGQLHHKDICLMGIQIAKQLKIIYEKSGILHLDIKPENILVDPYGNSCLVDFGAAISHIESCNMFNVNQMGTPGYLSPERFVEPNAIGPQSDLYGLAMSLKYLVSHSEDCQFSLWEYLSNWCSYGAYSDNRCCGNTMLYDLFIQGLWEQLGIY